METPRANTILFSVYVYVCIGIFVAAFFFPELRAVSYAPLRDLLLPAPQPVVVSLLYSTEKEAWLTEAIARYAATNPRFHGRSVQIEATGMGSREMLLAVLNGEEQPVIFSPASSLQSAILEDLSAQKSAQAGATARAPGNCRPVVSSPVVLVAWRERAEAVWGSQPGGDLWNQIHDLSVDPRGWEHFGRPEWGYFKFGHTNPTTSNSGLMTTLLMTYQYFGKTSGLTSQDLLSSPEYQAWFLDIENSISQFGESTGTYMRDMTAYGPSVYDMVSVYEATAIEQAENAAGRYGELRVYYPPATVVSDHPFCILSGEWVTSDQVLAADAFIRYLLTPEIQQLALLQYGFRPVEASVALDQAGSPFVNHASLGLRVDLPPVAETPAGDVLNTLLDLWSRNVHR